MKTILFSSLFLFAAIAWWLIADLEQGGHGTAADSVERSGTEGAVAGALGGISTMVTPPDQEVNVAIEAHHAGSEPVYGAAAGESRTRADVDGREVDSGALMPNRVSDAEPLTDSDSEGVLGPAVAVSDRTQPLADTGSASRSPGVGVGRDGTLSGVVSAEAEASRSEGFVGGGAAVRRASVATLPPLATGRGGEIPDAPVVDTSDPNQLVLDVPADYALPVHLFVELAEDNPVLNEVMRYLDEDFARQVEEQVTTPAVADDEAAAADEWRQNVVDPVDLRFIAIYGSEAYNQAQIAKRAAELRAMGQ